MPWICALVVRPTTRAKQKIALLWFCAYPFFFPTAPRAGRRSTSESILGTDLEILLRISLRAPASPAMLSPSSAADDAAGNGAASAARSAATEGAHLPPPIVIRAQHGVQGRHNNSAHWPFTFNSTVDGTIDAKYYAAYQAAWSPTSKVNTHENVYHHMLQLRTLQPRGAHGHIGFYPLQTFKYYWEARRITNALRLAKQARWPITCEVGFGTGMSTSVGGLGDCNVISGIFTHWWHSSHL